jgi:hypothetical protein
MSTNRLNLEALTLSGADKYLAINNINAIFDTLILPTKIEKIDAVPSSPQLGTIYLISSIASAIAGILFGNGGKILIYYDLAATLIPHIINVGANTVLKGYASSGGNWVRTANLNNSYTEVTATSTLALDDTTFNKYMFLVATGVTLTLTSTKTFNSLSVLTSGLYTVIVGDTEIFIS